MTTFRDRTVAAAFADWVPRAVVFDCDGLLMDTEPCWVAAETRVFARRELEFTTELQSEFIGRAMNFNSVVMAELFDEPDNAKAIEAEVLETVTEVMAARAVPMAGANALVELVSAHAPVAVASNSPRVLLDAMLERGGFGGTFAVSVCSDDVAQPKPAPDIYEAACERLGERPADVLALEDSLTGLASARAAGLRVLGVPTLAHDEFPADHVLDSLLDPSLAAWVADWN